MEFITPQNERIWAPNRADADVKGGIRQVQKFPKNIMVWLGACSKGVSLLVIFENGTIDHERYIQEVLPVALKFGNDMLGDNWTFQQDGGRPHIHRKTQDWCRTHLPCLIDKDHWHRNSPDLNPWIIVFGMNSPMLSTGIWWHPRQLLPMN
ncbi:unnamed protein product [Rotaria magnacalcarata]|uniref:Uncharacterized protein n=1 Tax=Rotaria magnacalcarata TaxID=392030 RepID=A0A816TKQ4_9BILA|nr:unnamed protein product [Rotaria magnacalcarata]